MARQAGRWPSVTAAIWSCALLVWAGAEGGVAAALGFGGFHFLGGGGTISAAAAAVAAKTAAASFEGPGAFGAALTAALAPHHLHRRLPQSAAAGAAAAATAAAPAEAAAPATPLPAATSQHWVLSYNATAAIRGLLSEPHLEAAAAHWQAGEASLQAVLGVLRRGREELVARYAAPASAPSSAGNAAGGDGDASATLVQEAAASGPNAAAGAGAAAAAWMAEAGPVVEALPAGTSTYALLRRGVGAVLAVAWQAAGASWTREHDDLAMRLLLQLYDLHRAAAANRSALEFYHVSKAGGTSLCTTSADVGCTTQSTNEMFTCLIPSFGDGPRWFSRKAHATRCRRTLPDMSRCKDRIYGKLAQWGKRYSERQPHLRCSDRAAWLAARGYNMYASEYTLRGRNGNVRGPPALCREFLNTVLLREPRARLRSHMRYAVRVMHDQLRNNTSIYFASSGGGGGASSGATMGGGMSLRDWRHLLPAALDNFYTRSLLGERMFYAPLGGFNASVHVPSAVGVLANMDVVLLLESTEEQSHLGHKWGLGWDRTMLQASGRSSEDEGETVHHIAAQALPTGTAEAELYGANALDEQVYAYGSLLSRLDGVVWVAAEARRGRPLKGLVPLRRRAGGDEATGDGAAATAGGDDTAVEAEGVGVGGGRQLLHKGQRGEEPGTGVGIGGATMAGCNGGSGLAGDAGAPQRGRRLTYLARGQRRCGYVPPAPPPLAPAGSSEGRE